MLKKHLLFIEANTTGTGLLALETAHGLGFNPVFFTHKPQRYPGLVEKDYPVITCDTNSLAALQHAIDHNGLDEASGIMSTSEFYLETVAHLAAHYHLPGNSPEAIARCRNKALTRLALEQAGILQPRFLPVDSLSTMDEIGARLPLPCVVKPADDTGSYMVRLCQTAQEAYEQITLILQMTLNIRGQQCAQTALIEEFIEGPEYSVEMFTWQDRSTCIGVTEKQVGSLPCFVEHRHIFPAPLSSATQKEIVATVTAALRALGITHGATHTEVKLTPKGCVIIEINARLAGGMIPELIRSASGMDILAQHILAACGQPPRLYPTLQQYAGIQFFIAPFAGMLERIDGQEEVRTSVGVVQFALTTSPGRHVSLPASSYDRLGYVIVAAQSYEEVMQRLQAATMKLDLHIVED